ncbi:hypothetical protein WG66_007522, partial [Moniliophthora roreri]
THPSFTTTVPLPFAKPYAFGPESEIPDPDYDETYQNIFDQLERSIKEIEKTGAVSLTMEHPICILPRTTLNDGAKYPHSYQSTIQVVDYSLGTQEEATELELLAEKTNPTIFSDRFFQSITYSIITIRHPARDLFLHNLEVISRYRWERLIFESCQSQGIKVMVVDGDKLVKDSKAQMKKVCEELGVDESQIQYTWDSADDQNDGLYSHFPESARRAFLGTLHGSENVIQHQGKTEALDLAAEERKWGKEWNEELAGTMRRMVNSSLEDYEYLLQFSI